MDDRPNTERFGRFYNVPVDPPTKIDLTTQVFRHSAFPDDGLQPWLDRPDALTQIEERLRSGEITHAEAGLCRKWHEDGYLILSRFFSDEELDTVWAAYEKAIAEGRVIPPKEVFFEGDELPGRVLNPHFHVEEVRQMLFDQRMSDVVSLLLGAQASPFQTIIGHKTSEQLQHSDSIHMTTYPTGYLAANWIAFEDIHPDCGPLVYHPGSHKLPYLMSDELGIPYDVGYKGYRTIYEPAIQKLISDHNLEPKYFLAKKGDVLLWHANLLHGGSKLRDPAHVSRKALVCHFFAQGCTCYHDLTAMPAYINPIEFDQEGYLAANPDVAASDWEPFRHYILHGRYEGRASGKRNVDHPDG